LRSHLHAVLPVEFFPSGMPRLPRRALRIGRKTATAEQISLAKQMKLIGHKSDQKRTPAVFSTIGSYFPWPQVALAICWMAFIASDVIFPTPASPLPETITRDPRFNFSPAGFGLKRSFFPYFTMNCRFRTYDVIPRPAHASKV
jgi:hypothetical protein